MKAEILSIGTEITTGQNLDTNSQWLSRQLSALGIHTGFHTTVADDRGDNVAAFRAATSRAALVIATGGLGPTADDLTREVVAALAGVPLVEDAAALEHLRGLFAARNRTMPDRNRVQASFPRGATIVPNPEGTAPGIWLEVGEALLLCLPGVPREMRTMFEGWALPRLAARFGGGRATVFRVVKCFGSGESNVEERLGDMIRRGRDPEIGITASEATISLRIVAHGATPAEAAAKAEPDVRAIREKLGELVFGEGTDELQGAVGALLAAKGRTVATAESCTGGLVGHLLTEVPGSSAYYLGGVVAYANEAKIAHLGVAPELIARHGAVSAEVARALAAGARGKFGADYGLGITGVAGPGGGTAEKPVGMVHVAVAGPKEIRHALYNWPAERSAVKLRGAKAALNLLRLMLLAE